MQHSSRLRDEAHISTPPTAQIGAAEESSAGPRCSSVARSPGDRKLAIINLLAVLLPVLGLAGAIVLLWGVAFNGWYLLLFGGMSIISAAGITVGYHRLCTHKSFTTPAVLRYLFAAAGSMAVQGPVIRWCAEHRNHHQHSDSEHDPHSPHMSRHGSWGEGFVATLRGAFHAHMGWLLAGRSRGLARIMHEANRPADDPDA